MDLQNNYRCDLEKLDDKGGFLESSGKQVVFDNGKSRSGEYSFSGSYSIKLYPENTYGLTTIIKDIFPDDYMVLTTWRKGDAGVLVADGGEGFYYAGQEIVEISDNGWEKIQLEVFVPPTFTNGRFKIYIWNNSLDTVFYDDFKITHRKDKIYPEFAEQEGLNLNIDPADIQKLGDKRMTAFETSILMNSDEDYSNAVIFDGNDFLNGSVRLKGDLVDHLLGQKWSFRIKLKKDYAWKNMRTFSIQNPLTRYFLHEWLAHKIFDEEDILTTRYGFIPVQLNNTSLGIYAWEEHFEKQLVESRNRREGPIIRFNENIFWQLILESNVTKRNWDIDFFSASKIIPFKERQTSSDSLKILQFEEAQNLLLQYKNRSKKVSEVFDMEKLAAYYALIDLTQAYHGFTWHNQRFYYNPVTCLLEPIAFDGYTEAGIYKRIDEQITGLLEPQKISGFKKEELMLFQVFSDSVFNAKYIEFLTTYSSNEYVESVIKKYKNESDSLSEMIKREFPYHNFNFDFLQSQAGYIRNNIPEIRNNIQKIGEAVELVNNENFRKEYTTDINENLVPFQVHAFYDRAKNELQVLNFTNSTVRVLGVFMNDRLPISFDSENELAPFNGFNESKIIQEVEGEPLKLLFSVNKEMYETEISYWQPPKENSVRQKTIANAKLADLPINGNRVVFEGNFRFENDIVIPQYMQVIFQSGTKIDLVNNAGFFCFSSVKMEGTESQPIEIISSDGSSNGFNVLQPKNRSSLKNVHFTGMSNLRKGGWQTPAAVTFYEADVDMENCTFDSNSNCDDALNVVRSNFNAQNCKFENTFADAFDSDFSTGIVSSCSFQNIGNDAIDFSGSVVKIMDCTMNEIGDKAISGGEKSTLDIENCWIENANIGVASKDLSLVVLNKINMDNTVYGLVAFIKKPEYGPARIEIENLKMKKNIVFHQIEMGSTLELNGTTIEGREKKLAVKLYQ